MRGRPDLARPLLEEALADPRAFEFGSGFLPGGVYAQTTLVLLLAAGGELERSAAHAREALAHARTAGHVSYLANALLSAGIGVAWLLGDPASVRDRARELAELAEAHGYPHHATRARCYLGWIAAAEGRAGEGIGLVAGAVAAQRAEGNALSLPHSEAMLADAHLLGGDPDAALRHIEEAQRISERTGEAWFDAELHRRRGGVLLRLDRPGDAARAEAEFQRALEIARSQSALLFELRAARDLARLWRDQGRVAEARELLAPVYASFTEGFARPDLVEAKTLWMSWRPVAISWCRVSRQRPLTRGDAGVLTAPWRRGAPGAAGPAAARRRSAGPAAGPSARRRSGRRAGACGPPRVRRLPPMRRSAPPPAQDAQGPVHVRLVSAVSASPSRATSRS
jgi:tetratricopeptide (TPR) repeat protein